MMPFTQSVAVYELPSSAQTSPELRRMDIYNRARREEMDALLYNLNPRQTVAYERNPGGSGQESIITKIFNGLRFGIGSALITAGNRIQSTA